MNNHLSNVTIDHPFSIANRKFTDYLNLDLPQLEQLVRNECVLQTKAVIYTLSIKFSWLGRCTFSKRHWSDWWRSRLTSHSCAKFRQDNRKLQHFGPENYKPLIIKAMFPIWIRLKFNKIKKFRPRAIKIFFFTGLSKFYYASLLL